MNLVKALAFCAIALSCIRPAIAATWYATGFGSEETRHYFDADSVEKSRDIVSLWTKAVQTRKASENGSWASAIRWRINCKRRTIQVLSYSLYDSNGKFLRSGDEPGRETNIVPDSFGEGLSKMSCASDFPKNKSGVEYFRINDNDVFAATKRWTDWIDSHVDNAPK